MYPILIKRKWVVLTYIEIYSCEPLAKEPSRSNDGSDLRTAAGKGCKRRSKGIFLTHGWVVGRYSSG